MPLAGESVNPILDGGVSLFDFVPPPSSLLPRGEPRGGGPGGETPDPGPGVHLDRGSRQTGQHLRVLEEGRV